MLHPKKGLHILSAGRYPLFMPPHELRDNILFYFFDVAGAQQRGGGWGVDPEPRFDERRVAVDVVGGSDSVLF